MFTLPSFPISRSERSWSVVISIRQSFPLFSSLTGREAMKIATEMKDNLVEGNLYRLGWFNRLDEIPIGSGYIVRWTEHDELKQAIIKVQPEL